jgi:hypothetical protein
MKPEGDIAIRSEEAARLGRAWTFEDHDHLTRQLNRARHDRNHWHACWHQARLEIERLQKLVTQLKLAPHPDRPAVDRRAY